MLKVILVCFAFVAVAALTAAGTWRAPALRRLAIALLIVGAASDPIATFDYQFWSRMNVRGWELCWADAFAIGLLASGVLRGGARGFLTLLLPAWLLWLASVAISTLVSVHPGDSAYFLARMLRGVLVFLALAATLRDRRDLEAVLLGIVLVCLANEFWVLRGKYGFGQHQARGLFDHQNTMGMWLILGGQALLAAVLLRVGTPALRLACSVGWLCAVHAVIAGLSRGSMVAFAASTGVVLCACLLRGLDARKLRAAGALALCLGVGLALVAPTIARRFDDSGNAVSGRHREVMNAAAAAMWHDHHWLGVGPNGYPAAVDTPRYAQIHDELFRERGYGLGPDARRPPVESLYWQVLAEQGVLGAIALAVLLGTGLLMAAGKWLFNRDLLFQACALGAGVGLAANAAQSLLEHTLIHAPNLYLWAIWCAVLATLPWRSAPTAQLPAESRSVAVRTRAQRLDLPRPPPRELDTWS